MALPVEVNPIFEGNRYPIQRSLRFRASATAYLNRTPSVAGDRKTYTWSGWVKRGGTATSQYLFCAGAASTNFELLAFSGDNLYYFRQISSATDAELRTNAVFRDYSSWYHVLLSVNAATTSASIYVNGILQSLSLNDLPSNVNGPVNNTEIQVIAKRSWDNSQYFDGYLSEVNFIDGQALDPTSFGQYNEFGVWSPRKYGGSYGTNGFYLPFNDPTSATTLCYDRQLGYTDTSKNNWTPNNISVTAGVTYDAMTDVPPPSTIQNVRAGNYCAISPINGAGTALTISNANLGFGTASSVYGINVCTMSIRVKTYFEITLGSSAAGAGRNSYCGVGSSGSANSYSSASFFGADASAWSLGYSNTTAYISNNGTQVTQSGTIANGDIFMYAVDPVNGKIWFGRNGTWYAGDPATGASASYTNLPSEVFPVVQAYNSSTHNINFGQQPFSYTPPSGFLPLNSNNLPAPTIPNGAKVMAATTYTGTGSTQPITNGGNNTLGTTFQPDFVWIKNKGAAWNNNLYDVIRGTGKALYSDLTDAENTNSIYGYLSAFSASGFSATAGTTSGNLTNQSSSTYVAWQWNAGSGVTSTNTDGTVTGTVTTCVNKSAGFSVVTFTSSSPCTVGHGLGVAPSFIILKSRNNASGWSVYHSSVGNTGALNLQATTATSTSIDWWSNTSPTSLVFSIGANIINSWTWVAYCWAPIAGYSSMGSYTGNGSTDGPFVYTGFRPRWVMVKKSSATSNWSIIDTSRNTYNVSDSVLLPNTSGAEITSTSTANCYIDVLSNGFKARGNSGDVNDSGATYIYAAFAENPFKLALAR